MAITALPRTNVSEVTWRFPDNCWKAPPRVCKVPFSFQVQQPNDLPEYFQTQASKYPRRPESWPSRGMANTPPRFGSRNDTFGLILKDESGQLNLESATCD